MEFNLICGFQKRRKQGFRKKQIRQASVCRSISEGVPLAGNAGGSVYSVYYDLQEVIKDWNDMRFRMLKQVEDVCCGKYHYRRSA